MAVLDLYWSRSCPSGPAANPTAFSLQVSQGCLLGAKQVKSSEQGRGIIIGPNDYSLRCSSADNQQHRQPQAEVILGLSG